MMLSRAATVGVVAVTASLAPAASAAASAAAASPLLQVGFVCGFDEAYADHGTGSAMDLDVFGANDHCVAPPGTPPSWYEVGHFAVGGYHVPAACGLVVLADTDASLLAVPTGLTMNWLDEKDGKVKGSVAGGLFTPVCPDGFAALGSVALSRPNITTTNVTVADFPRLRCVAEGLTTAVPAADLALVWDDHGSLADYSGSVWTTGRNITTSSGGVTIAFPNFAGASDSYDAPAAARVLDAAQVHVATAPVHTCAKPEQVHTAFGQSPDVLAVQWSTLSAVAPDPPHVLQWGEDATALSSSATAVAVAFTSDSGRVWYNHVATMTGLKPVTKYFYRVGSNSDGWSDMFSITSQVTPDTIAQNLPQYHVVFGDMGAACAFTLCPACTCGLVCDAQTCAANTSVGLVSEVDKASMFLHVGDFGYNLDTNGGTTGDQFMRNIEQVAARVPYMVSIGNHEDGPAPLAHFTERFRLMPSAASVPNVTNTTNGVAPNNWFFSWDDGLVHYVAISTEAWFGVGLGEGQATLAQQYEWLKSDLAKANANRDAVPWIVVHGHRSMYCSCDSDCDAAATIIRDGKFGLEELFMDNGVDFFLNGHEHNYERNWPTYKGKSDQSNVEPKAPIYIITGAAGCSELHEPFTRPQPPRSAFRSNNFGYSRFIVHNASHARWQQVIMDPGDVSTGRSFFGADLPPMGTVIDDTWIIQSHHGPFNRSEAPQATGVCTEETCKTLDHWGERFTDAMRGAARAARRAARANASEQHLHRGNITKLGIGAATPQAHEISAQLIGQFRDEFGEGVWVDVELAQLQAFIAAFPFDNIKWEDVSPDGGSDGKWGEGVYEPYSK